MTERPPLEVHRLVADRGDDRHRLDRVLVRRLAHLPEISRSIVGRWIGEGRIAVDGEVEKRASRKVRHRETIEVALPKVWGDRPPVEAEEVPVEVIFEDESLIVVAKEAGRVVHPTWGHQKGTLLNGLLWLARDWPAGQRPHLVHRLDQDTSGVLLVAKSSQMARRCGLAFAKRRPEKLYLAVVRGTAPLRKGRIERALARDESRQGRWVAVDEGGLAAVTEWEWIADDAGRELSLVCCRLLTGRTHQIRAHLSSIGLPLVGDPVYGAAATSRLRNRELDAYCRDFPRQALHAWRLRLEHPLSGRTLELEAQPPADLRGLLKVAGLDESFRRYREVAPAAVDLSSPEPGSAFSARQKPR